MEFKLVADLLNFAGTKTAYTTDRLEQVPFPYENYYLLKKDGNKWAYGLFIQERTNNPYLSNVKIFDTKEEGSRHFFLKRLESHYFTIIIQPLLSRKELQIYDDTFDIPKLKHALSVAGVSDDLFYVDEEPDHRAIVLETKGEDYSIAFYGEKGEKISSYVPRYIMVHSDATPDEVKEKIAAAPPLELREALFFVFQKVVKLHLFETRVSALLEKNLCPSWINYDTKAGRMIFRSWKALMCFFRGKENVVVTFTDEDLDCFLTILG
ncbi:hypothetical protein NSQ26_04775 [Bacillus sp. FSL W7-1360]